VTSHSTDMAGCGRRLSKGRAGQYDAGSLAEPYRRAAFARAAGARG